MTMKPPLVPDALKQLPESKPRLVQAPSLCLYCVSSCAVAVVTVREDPVL